VWSVLIVNISTSTAEREDSGRPPRASLYVRLAGRSDADVVSRFRSSQSEIWQTLRVVPSDSCCLTLHGLRSWTRYQFMILARDQSGVAHFSRVVNAMTARLSSEPATKVADDQAHQINFLGLVTTLSVVLVFQLLTTNTYAHCCHMDTA